MAPLIILIVSFAFLFLIDRFLLSGKLGMSLSGRIALGLMLLVTGIAHFTSPEPMTEMLPDFVPYKKEMIYFTGVCELLAIPGLLWEKTRRLTSVMLILFFLLILPANIYGSIKSVGLGGMEYGPWYLLFRVPLQILFIGWTWYFGLKLEKMTVRMIEMDQV